MPEEATTCAHCEPKPESSRLIDGAEKAPSNPQLHGDSPLDQIANPAPDSMGLQGGLLILLGVVLITFSFFFDVSVSTNQPTSSFGLDLPARLANTDLMGIRQMICLCGNGSFLAGCILLAASRLRDATIASIRR
jgi:hypothetical protein